MCCVLNPSLRSSASIFAAAVASVCLCLPGSRASAQSVTPYVQTNLVSDGSVPALFKDANLINPWGLAYSPSGPFWVANNNSGTSTLYNGAGSIVPLVVTVPGNPTGQVFNGSSGFGGSSFIFAGEGGLITGWNGGTSTNILVDNSTKNSVYKGLAIGLQAALSPATATTVAAGPFIYASDFHNARVDVYDGMLNPVNLGAGKFADTSLPTGYAPFNIQQIGGKLYVTYALQNAAKHDDVSGAGHGYVDVFDLAGNNLGRLISGGVLDSPWGLAIAPADFGSFSNDLLVGNFGNGKINAFNPTTGDWLGSLSDKKGNPILINDLWALTVGNGGSAGKTNELFFTSGVKDEAAGLFGKLTPASTISTVPLPRMIYVMPFALFMAGIAIRRCNVRAKA